MKQNNIVQLKERTDFKLDNLLYKHRQYIYKGLLFDITKVFVKRYSLTSIEDITIILNELDIIETLVHSKLEIVKMVQTLLAVYIDKENNLFYTFFEYLPFRTSCLAYQIFTMDQKEKINTLRNLLKFVLDLHAEGIIHRDLRLDFFLLDEENNLKTFDLMNAMKINVEHIKLDKLTLGNDLNNVRNIRNISNITNQIKYDYKTEYLTAKYTAPEITLCAPREGWGQDIWSLGCLVIEMLIDYTQYQESLIEILLTKIFRGETPIPKIPKDVDQNLAVIISKCFYTEPYLRIDMISLINKFNKYFKKIGLALIELEQEEKFKYIRVREVYKQNYLIEYLIQKKKKEELLDLEYCKYNHGKQNVILCEDCDEFFCEDCIEMTHGGHSISNIIHDPLSKKNLLMGLYMDIEEKYCETNFILIDEFRNTFENDYQNEKIRIKKQYQEIRARIDNLEKLELANLDQSNKTFLEARFDKIFQEADKVANYYKTFYFCKDQFFSYNTRFIATLQNKEINVNTIRKVNRKFDKLNEYSESLLTNGKKLIERCADLRIPGKYIFRHEQYTDDVLKNLKTIENKIYEEKHKFFDYSGSDSLFITKELLMIIPHTNCVFSYVKNSYKKFQVDFNTNKIKKKSFLPGCATLHLGNFFYLTGGELKDESMASFMWMDIEKKVLEDGLDMNFCRRYHSMISLGERYLCVVGGWNSSEVEIMDVEALDSWKIITPMNDVRADPTLFFFNNQYIYVFGGWDYQNNKCLGEVERYEIFDSEGNINFHNNWETIKIKNNKCYLQKYNMGLINLIKEKDENSEKILLVGGFDDEYDYSSSVVKIEISNKEAGVIVNKEIKGLPIEGETSFWYEKNFHLMNNDFQNEPIAVNFNCFNNIYVYSLIRSEFKLYTNTKQSNIK